MIADVSQLHHCVVDALDAGRGAAGGGVASMIVPFAASVTASPRHGLELVLHNIIQHPLVWGQGAAQDHLLLQCQSTDSSHKPQQKGFTSLAINGRRCSITRL
jgi:hypothetical protein